MVKSGCVIVMEVTNWGMWDMVASDGTAWALAILRAPVCVHFLVTSAGNIHYRDRIDCWNFGPDEMWILIGMITRFYEQLSRETLKEAAKWVKQCCTEMIPQE
jgi:hypothetical protein